MFGRMKRSFVSSLDQFLFDFDDKKQNLSASQQSEVQKANRVEKMRDNANYESTPDSVWDDF